MPPNLALGLTPKTVLLPRVPFIQYISLIPQDVSDPRLAHLSYENVSDVKEKRRGSLCLQEQRKQQEYTEVHTGIYGAHRERRMR